MAAFLRKINVDKIVVAQDVVGEKLGLQTFTKQYLRIKKTAQGNKITGPRLDAEFKVFRNAFL